MRSLAALFMLVVMLGASSAQQPMTARQYYERGLKHEAQKRYTEALADYSKAIELDPLFYDALFSRSSLYSSHPDFTQRDYRKAVDDLSKILEFAPRDFSPRFNRALDYESLREYDKAIADYSHIIEKGAGFSRNGQSIEFGQGRAFAYRGRAYDWYKGEYAKAVADYTQALKLNPDLDKDQNIYCWRGRANHMLKEYAKAEADFKEAMKRTPTYSNLLCCYSWMLATCPDAKFRDGKKAVELAEAGTIAIGNTTPEHLDVQAAAYAEVGRFADAVARQKEAMSRLDKRTEPMRKGMEARLKLYEAGKPYRTE
jgi:tetratricopeptide (TPR) repeat protein